jgi:D-glycero-D-manno-heptose 1,7-bisphosphate phosphatase
MNNFIIFDRDGTLIEFEYYLIDPALVKINESTIRGLKVLSANGFKFGVVSNQSIIGRGVASIEQVDLVNNKMLEQFNTFGINFEFIYYCPHNPIDVCSCRKPGTALGVRALSEHQINVEKSYMIGDMDSDIEFGNSLNLTTIKIHTNKSDIAEFTAKDILSAAKWIIGKK